MNNQKTDKPINKNDELVDIQSRDPFDILSEKIKNENIDETIKTLRKRINSKYKF